MPLLGIGPGPIFFFFWSQHYFLNLKIFIMPCYVCAYLCLCSYSFWHTIWIIICSSWILWKLLTNFKGKKRCTWSLRTSTQMTDYTTFLFPMIRFILLLQYQLDEICFSKECEICWNWRRDGDNLCHSGGGKQKAWLPSSMRGYVLLHAKIKASSRVTV